jgi:hypothetical protein
VPAAVTERSAELPLVIVAPPGGWVIEGGVQAGPLP